MGGERMRFTFPALITASIKLCRRYKIREHVEPEWQTKVATILKFVRQLTSILATQVDSPAISLRLFLLAAQIADECGFEDLAYDFYVQAFSVYEDSISESRSQLQAITLIIGTLAAAKVFTLDNYDTLITKAALHGAKLLKKSHQATAVGLASHLWWQQAGAGLPSEDHDHAETPATAEKAAEKANGNGSDKADASEKSSTSSKEDVETPGPKAVRASFHGTKLGVDEVYFPPSTRIKIASEYWNAFRKRCALPTLPSKKS